MKQFSSYKVKVGVARSFRQTAAYCVGTEKEISQGKCIWLFAQTPHRWNLGWVVLNTLWYIFSAEKHIFQKLRLYTVGRWPGFTCYLRRPLIAPLSVVRPVAIASCRAIASYYFTHSSFWQIRQFLCSRSSVVNLCLWEWPYVVDNSGKVCRLSSCKHVMFYSVLWAPSIPGMGNGTCFGSWKSKCEWEVTDF